MDLKQLTSELSVSGQILPADMKAIKEAGFRAIICNRPDGEEAGQPTFDDVSKAAKDQGLEAVYQPIVASQLGDENVAEFDEALTELPGPILAYCRTGTRCAILWSLSQAGERDVADIIAITRAAGYDMSGLVQRIANDAKSANNTPIPASKKAG